MYKIDELEIEKKEIKLWNFAFLIIALLGALSNMPTVILIGLAFFIIGVIRIEALQIQIAIVRK